MVSFAPPLTTPSARVVAACRCYSCNNCQRRQDCGGTTQGSLASDYDRYELSFTFDTPSKGSAAWPLTLRVERVELYLQDTNPVTGQLAVLSTMTTDAGDYFKDMYGIFFPVRCCQPWPDATAIRAGDLGPTIPLSGPTIPLSPPPPFLPFARAWSSSAASSSSSPL